MIAAIVQARMTSTRLPGKVMKEVMGRPLLSYQIERLRAIDNIDEIIIATTIKKEDASIVQLCMKESVPYFRGSEYDVLDRYYQAAKKFGIKYIIRITADCPLIDPQICEHIVKVYFNERVDYVCLDSSFAEGLDCEVLSFKALEKAWKKANLKSEREHVTLYMHNHPDVFKKFVLKNKTYDSKYRFTVDEKEDFFVVKDIIEGLYSPNTKPFAVSAIKSFLDSHPEVFSLNTNIIRNEGFHISLKDD